MNFILNWTSFISDRFQIGCRMVHDQYWYVISRIWRYQSVKRMDQYEGTTTRIKNFFTEPSTVVNGLYLGNIYNAADLNTLKNMNITHVVNVSKNISNYFPDKFTYFNIKIDIGSCFCFNRSFIVVTTIHRGFHTFHLSYKIL